MQGNRREQMVVTAAMVLAAWLGWGAGAMAGGEDRGRFVPAAERVEQLAAMLPAEPCGVGRPITDRAAWQALGRVPGFERVVSEAERLLRRPMPALTEELYLDFSRTGNRSRCQRVLSARHSRLSALVLAECLENKGRFLPAIEETIRAICSEKTWVLPAHDRRLRNFRGEVNEIDLAVAGLSWNVATARYWLGERLSEAARRLIRDELERRTFRPFESMVTKGKPRMWWLTTTNNWNAVCLAGVTGAALATIESPQRRAFFVAAAEKAIGSFLSGFTPDGYCSEGIGYWNYGFGHFVLLTETLWQATGGELDLARGAKIARIAQFGRRMEILPGVYPAFADCHVGTEPAGWLMAWLNRRFGLGLKGPERSGRVAVAALGLTPRPTSALFELGLMGFANSVSRRPAAEAASSAALRDWFPDAGVLICRPAPGSGARLGAAIKGGHNAEHHNHNDVGTYVVAVGRATPLVDPGSEVYTARTFSSRRYDSGVLNSYGHPVPLVAGRRQRSGRSAAAGVLQTRFSDQVDTLVLDLRSAYAVKPLERLRRSFVFSRAGAGSLTVTDEVSFSQPAKFGTALITFSTWQRLGPNRLRVGESGEAVLVEIATDGPAFEVAAEQIREDLPGGRIPTRIGIELSEPVRQATITVKIVPQ